MIQKGIEAVYFGRFSSPFSFCGLYLRERWVLITSLSLYPLLFIWGNTSADKPHSQTCSYNNWKLFWEEKKKNINLLKYGKKCLCGLCSGRQAPACFTCSAGEHDEIDHSSERKHTGKLYKSLYSWFSHEQTGFMTY